MEKMEEATKAVSNAIKELCEEAVKAVDLTPDGIAAFLKSHPEKHCSTMPYGYHKKSNKP